MTRGPSRRPLFRKARHLSVGAGLVATAPIPKGTAIRSWRGCRVLPRPTYQSVQIGVRSHVHDPVCLNLLNHSCDPNLAIDVRRRTVKAMRAIDPGELLTIFYPATEWDMARPFRCRCGAPRGLRWVRGARHMPGFALRGRPLSRHIKSLLRRREASRHREALRRRDARGR